jgi:uncharacterized protein (DUF4415 family)
MGSKKRPDPYMFDEDNPRLTDEEMAQFRPTREVLAELGIPMPRTRGRPPVEVPKRQVTLRLDETVVEHFKRGGKGWQTRINDTLAAAIKSGR